MISPVITVIRFRALRGVIRLIIMSRKVITMIRFFEAKLADMATGDLPEIAQLDQFSVSPRAILGEHFRAIGNGFELGKTMSRFIVRERAECEIVVPLGVRQFASGFSVNHV